MELTVPAALEYRELVTRASEQACRRLAERGTLDDEFGHAVVSAVSEAFNNVVKHSYAGMPAGDVTFFFRISDAALEIEMLDRGLGFDPVDEPNLEVPGLHESGMGLFIMRACMDEIEHRNGSPNRLRLKKYVPEPAA